MPIGQSRVLSSLSEEEMVEKRRELNTLTSNSQRCLMSDPKLTRTDPSHALAEAQKCLASDNLPEAMLWVGTANVLEQGEERLSLASPVNSACFRLVARALNLAETRIVYCGNILAEHGRLIRPALEALAIITAKLPKHGATSQEFENLTMVAAHLQRLEKTYRLHLDEASFGRYVGTSARQASDFTNTIVACRQLLVKVVEKAIPAGSSKGPDADLVKQVQLSETARMRLAETAISNAQHHIFGFPIAFLTEFEQAEFFAAAAERLTAPAPEAGGDLAAPYRAPVLDDFKAALAAAVAAIKRKDNPGSRKELSRARALILQLGYHTLPHGL